MRQSRPDVTTAPDTVVARLEAAQQVQTEPDCASLVIVTTGLNEPGISLVIVTAGLNEAISGNNSPRQSGSSSDSPIVCADSARRGASR